MVVFPLVNRLSDPLHSWIAYAIPDNFARKLGEIDGIRVWDPLFMFQTDSSGWHMHSDSILLVHSNRWEWDAAVGGTYSVAGDSITIQLRIIWVTGTRQPVGMDLQRTAHLKECPSLCTALLLQTCSLLHLELTHDDSVRIEKPSRVLPDAFYTYCAGYGFEMNRRYAEALTAYNRAVQIDPDFTLAWCRMGLIYSQTGKMREAVTILKRVMKNRTRTPQASAMAAEFAVDELDAAEAFRFIDKSRSGLEKSAEGLTVIGRQYLYAGEYQRAIASFRRAIAWGTVNLDAEFLLGVAYLMSAEYLVATDLFNRLISIRPDYLRYHVLLGAVYRKSGRLMESLSVLEVARKKEPDNTTVLIEMAHTCFELGWYRKAGQLLEQALQLKPDQNDILVDLGIVYWHEKRFADAQMFFKKAGNQVDGAMASFVNTGNISLYSGNVKAAIAAYRKADRSGEKNPAIQYNLAMAYLAAGNVKKAAHYLDELLMQTPGRIDLLLQRARLAQKLGKDEDAEVAFHRVLENDPYDDNAVEGLVRLLLSHGRYEEAVYRIESYLEAKPARADFMLLLADAYLAQGWYEVAITRYRRIVKDFPDYGAGYLGVGRCMYAMIMDKKTGFVDEALYALKQASSIIPGNPQPYILMGDLYMEVKGYRDMAVEQWRKALTLSSNAQEKRGISRKIDNAERR